MKRSFIAGTLCIATVFWVTSRPASAQCKYARYRHVILGPQTQVGNPWCNETGVNGSTFDPADACPYRVRVWRDTISCATDLVTSSTVESAPAGIAGIHCPCDKWDKEDLATKQDGTFAPSLYGCDVATCDWDSSPDPEPCDGHDVDQSQNVDEGCGDGEFKCNAQDKDGAPVRFTSGRVELNPLTLFSAPAPDGIFFGHRLLWGSHIARTAAHCLNRTGDNVIVKSEVGMTRYELEADGLAHAYFAPPESRAGMSQADFFWAKNVNWKDQYIGERKVILTPDLGRHKCLKQLLVHEALHSSLKTLTKLSGDGYYAPYTPEDRGFMLRRSAPPGTNEHEIISDVIRDCVQCR